jgi:hypothetical protein
MLQMLSDFTRDFTSIDGPSLTILLVMVGWATLLIQLSVDSKSYTAIFVPGMVLGGMAAFYIARISMFMFASAKDINAIMLSVIGIVAGFMATLCVIRLLQWLADLRRPLTLDTRS